MEPNNPTSSLATKPRVLNYAGAIFFTLLIVGFTFQLPVIIMAPLIFFTIAAGVIFFKDLLSGMSIGGPASKAGSPPPGMSRRAYVIRHVVIRLVLWVLILAGICAILYVGFIILVLVLLSAGGGFG